MKTLKSLVVVGLGLSGIMEKQMKRMGLFKYVIGISATAALAAFSLGGAFAGSPPSKTGTLAPLTGALVGDGTMSTVASKAMIRGALRLPADEQLKAAANKASAAAQGGGGAAVGASSFGPSAPFLQQNIAGQSDAGVSPPDTFGATGPTRYVQVVNRRYGIYSRAGALINAGTLNQLFGLTANNFDPQVIWDDTTNRFYYAGDSVVSSTDNRLAWGFSKSSSPNNGTTDWCHYTIGYGSKFPDYPKLGDSQLFTFIGVNNFNFQDDFVGSDMVAVRKPVGTGTITTCPTVGFAIYPNLKDAANTLVYTPTPGNFIDSVNNGYSVSRTLGLPSTRLIIHAYLGGSATTFPSLQSPRTVAVASYTVPPAAIQPSFTQRLDTLDARPWQAILSINPARSNAISMWTQHTIDGAGATDSDIRFYEIRPDLLAPTVLRTGTIGALSADNSINYFNGAISSDRRVNNAATGNNIVIGFNVSSATLSPRIVVGSSVAGGALQFQLIQAGLGPYRDSTCATAGSTCRWGDYASADPDPAPQGGVASAVGLTHQWSAGGPMPTTQYNWTSRIYYVRP